MNAIDKLVAHSKKVAHYHHLAAICGWDQAAVMPTGGAQARAGAMAELHVHIHQLMTKPELADWIAQAEQDTLSQEQSAVLRELKRQYRNANVLPSDLVEAKSLAGATCEHAWRTQRKANDWQGFEKNWAEVVNLSQQEAQIRAEAAGCSAYDAMLELYEPDTTTAQLDVVFSDVKRWLPDLVNQVIEKQSTQSVILPTGHYPSAQQKALGQEVMTLLQFDFNHGRLDESVHPFCGGVPTDVRITTRYNEAEFVQSLMGIVHETGHARYEQGLPKHLAGLSAGEARSMGIHESQSLFFEMQIGRSAEFVAHLSRLAANHFANDGQASALFSPQNLQRLYTQVEKGYIRVDADELTYPAHVILRYEIERDLINGNISHRDVPELWDAKMQASLNLSTQGNYQNGCMQDIHWTDGKRTVIPSSQATDKKEKRLKKHNYKDGCMQDIHWCDGSFGYFPSYTLGAMYAAQFMASMKNTVDVDGAIQAGDLSPIFAWLSDNIWSKGSLLTTDELVTQATGETLNPLHFQNHLRNRYL